ncbi:hypothetical protein [Lactiplantibacillus plantarum]|uniref:hypothetical protein n=1 Tax=Lactiplantibacillus plantarum TaxID=1590 RepID=UPI000DD4175B|nr:hypothetical protein [Lactiplantibacillus plantarum]MCG0739770.1 hypothetical protein [Lactiplantibacillus plantarum]MCJ1648663.1 hypothetical protein [Lactiplantibacillus plantarum subsp. plantarum]MDI5784234.1 hypothetical protein [Lactiplantibacillus plantarum]MDN7029777.1 hypothetical protein [Lactiplantibacillus plantarum]MDY2576856.1 hypothetical protein [Lactiplantibacillus plantarum]
MKLQKLEIRQFLEAVSSFLKSNKTTTLLVRGFFMQDNLKAVLEAMQEDDNLKTSIFVTGDISEVPRLFNEPLGQKILKRPKLNTSYRLAGTTTQFIKRNQNVNCDFGFGIDLAVFYPVQNVLFEESDFNKFISKLHHSKANKNILIMTNDYSRRAEKLYQFVDEVLVLDTSQLDEKHSEKAKQLAENFKRDGKDLPY